MIEDINNIFENSKINEVFSTKGLSALANIEFYRMYIFYTLAFKTLAFFILLRTAINMDSNIPKVKNEVIY